MPAIRPRPSFARLVRRTIWVVTNLVLGHFVLFNAYFLSVLAFYEEDFDQPIVFPTGTVRPGHGRAAPSAAN